MKRKRINNAGPVILFSAIVFCVMFFTMLIVVGGLILLIKYGVLDNISGNFSESSFIILLMAILSTVIGLVISAFVGKITMKPVYKIINALNQLASGDYKVRLNIGTPFKNYPTMVELNESFNKMATELENTEMLRSDFINNFSHEFKTPIVSIAGFAKLLKRDNLSYPQTREYLDIIEEESMRLSYMATNVLNLTKVENQTILTDVTEFNVSEQLRTCVLLFENKWIKKNIDLNLGFGECMIWGNEELLKQIWINLIDNAIKYTPEFGTIDIGIKENPKNIMIAISNTGKEISDKNYEKIFNKFFQEDESHSSEGNGVGLAIVKKIVELHEGDIQVESGGGKTKFTVSIPRKI